jgi:ribosomal protein S18 acetylase RimI-like enzyme
VRPEDNDFQFKLYASTRQEEMQLLGWPAAQQEAFLRMQFSAQQNWYRTAYAQAKWEIVELNGKPVGRTIVLNGDDAITLVDISLLIEQRGKGFGGDLVRKLLEDGVRANLPVRLQVLKTNPAARLYARLGFIQTGEDDLYFKMEKRP